LGLQHRASIFRFLALHPDFPPAKKFGQRNTWARGAVRRWVAAQPDRPVGGDSAIAERLAKGRKTPHRFHPRRSAKPTRPATST
jgi:hypothetical protein